MFADVFCQFYLCFHICIDLNWINPSASNIENKFYLNIFIVLTLLASLSLKEIILNLKRSLTWTAKVQDKGSMSYARNKITLFEKFSFHSKCLNLATCPFCLLFQNKINFKKQDISNFNKVSGQYKKAGPFEQMWQANSQTMKKNGFLVIFGFFCEQQQQQQQQQLPTFRPKCSQVGHKNTLKLFFSFCYICHPAPPSLYNPIY